MLHITGGWQYSEFGSNAAKVVYRIKSSTCQICKEDSKDSKQKSNIIVAIYCMLSMTKTETLNVEPERQHQCCFCIN